MTTYLIQNNPDRFGFLVELEIEKGQANYVIHKISAEGEEDGDNLFFDGKSGGRIFKVGWVFQHQLW